MVVPRPPVTQLNADQQSETWPAFTEARAQYLADMERAAQERAAAWKTLDRRLARLPGEAQEECRHYHTRLLKELASNQ